MKTLSIVSFLFLSFTSVAQVWQSQIVPLASGKLHYISDDKHNRIPDYSHAGYKGGGNPIPKVPVSVTIKPGSGDYTKQIQAAIDRVEAMDPDENGIRGAVLLKSGKYLVEGTLVIDESGVVLRGEGDGIDVSLNTIIYRENPANDAKVIEIGSGNGWRSNNNIIEGTKNKY